MIERAPDLLALGETMLSLISVDGPLADASALHVTIGGAESNACVAATRAGASAAWVSRLGADAPGRRIRRALVAESVDLRWVREDPSRPTGLMLRDTSGAPATYRRAGSAASGLSPEDLEGVPVEDARAVLTSGITAMLGEGPCSAAHALLERARGLRVVDPNLRLGLWGSGRERELVLPLLARADLVLAGERELATLFGEDEHLRALAERCAGLGPREVVVKRGPLGAAALVGGEWLEYAGERSDDVDPVGAGDAFDGTYVAARLAGDDVAVALERAASAGAAIASAVGDLGRNGGTR